MKLIALIFAAFLLIGGYFAERYNTHVTLPLRQCNDMAVMSGQATKLFNDTCYIEVQGERFIPVAQVKDWVAFVRGLSPKQAQTKTTKVKWVDNPFE